MVVGLIAGIPRIGRPPRFSRLRFTVTLVLCTLVVLLSITAWWAERQLSGPLVEIARLRATNIASAAINRAVGEVAARTLDGAVLFEVVPREHGGPLIVYHTGRLNQAISETVDALLTSFADKRPEEFEVPLGELSGMSLLAGWGPPVPVRVLAAGAVTAEPKVDFLSAGINQVAHRIYLDVSVEMMVVAPFVRAPIVIRQPVILAEQLLPGEVPSAYVQFIGASRGLEEWLALQSSLQSSHQEAPQPAR